METSRIVSVEATPAPLHRPCSLRRRHPTYDSDARR
jgi:hypothetical protein